MTTKTQIPVPPTAKIGERAASAGTGHQQERRCEGRKAFPVNQFVAFHDESETPTKEMFKPVLCRDISTSGISFYHPGPAKAQYCTIALGRMPAITFVKTAVVHTGPCQGPNKEWVIGCQFLGKVTKPF